MPSRGSGPQPQMRAGESTTRKAPPTTTTTAGSRMLPAPRRTLPSVLKSQTAPAPAKTTLEYVSAAASTPSVPPMARYSRGPPHSMPTVNAAAKASAMRSPWSTSASASRRRPPPRARAIAEAIPTPMPPADIVCISMTSGNTRAMPASASRPALSGGQVARAARRALDAAGHPRPALRVAALPGSPELPRGDRSQCALGASQDSRGARHRRPAVLLRAPAACRLRADASRAGSRDGGGRPRRVGRAARPQGRGARPRRVRCRAGAEVLLPEVRHAGERAHRASARAPEDGPPAPRRRALRSGQRVADDLRLDHVDDHLRDVRGVVGHPLQEARDQDQPDGARDRPRVFHHEGQQLTEDLLLEGVDLGVFGAHASRELRVSRHEGIEGLLDHAL